MDIVIKNGTVVSSKETQKADLYIKDGKILNIDPDGIDLDSCEDSAVKVIDAEGKLVMPGGVDVHTHLDMPFMGTFSTDDFRTGTIAAAYGGTTSIIDYIIPQRNQSLIDAVNVWQQKAKDKAIIDYGFHMAIVPPIKNIIKELPKLVEQGITSIKCFLAYKNSLMISDEDLFLLMQEAKKLGILLCVHAENGNIIDLLTNQYLEQGNISPIYHALSRPSILEGEAVGKVLKLAKLAEIPVYFVHLSTKYAMKEIHNARKKYQAVYAETCPQYLLLSQSKYLKPEFEGAKYVMSPPLRENEHKKYLNNAVKTGKIDVIATDHCPFNFNQEKQLGRKDFTKIPNGIPGIETRMPLMFYKMVKKENIPLNKFVNVNCTRPAQIFGLKDKGDILVGKDADITIWDPNLEWTVKADCLHHNVDYTPFEGQRIIGKPITTIAAGNIVIEDNVLSAKLSPGKFIKRI